LEHHRRTNNDWEKVIWTDEATFERGEIKKKRRVWRRPGEEGDEIISTFKSGRFSVSAWAAIDSHNLPASKDELKERIVQYWNQLTNEELEKSTLTMPARAIDAHGGHTKY